MFILTAQPIDHVALRERIQRRDAGALIVFEGWVREMNAGRAVVSLEYEAAPDLCQSEADAIIAEAAQKFSVLEISVAHRTGHLQLGDMAVWIGVASAHRAASFDACRYVIEEIKKRLPVWKKEHYADGDSGWIGV